MRFKGKIVYCIFLFQRRKPIYCNSFIKSHIKINKQFLFPEMEKLEKQKHDKLQWILSKPPSKRSSDELVDLAKLLMKNNFLKQFSTNPDFIEMCRYLTLEICSEKQLVFSQVSFNLKRKNYIIFLRVMKETTSTSF